MLDILKLLLYLGIIKQKHFVSLRWLRYNNKKKVNLIKVWLAIQKKSQKYALVN